MTKDLEYYKKQEKVFERRINLLKKEVDKLTLDKNELKQQLSMRVVGSSAITDADLIAFAKWLDDMSYTHRLKIVPKDLTEFYLKNKSSILEQYS